MTADGKVFDILLNVSVLAGTRIGDLWMTCLRSLGKAYRIDVLVSLTRIE